MRVGQKAGKGFRKQYKTAYTVGPIATTLCNFFLSWNQHKPLLIAKLFISADPAAGGSDDWAYANTNASLTYCFELRDTGEFKQVYFLQRKWMNNNNFHIYFVGRFGFILPANQIIPNGEETTDAIVAMVAEARKLKYLWEKNHKTNTSEPNINIVDEIILGSHF